MSAETPAFLDALRTAIEKFTPVEEATVSETGLAEFAYLREKLLAVQAACMAYDKKTAKDALAALREKAWAPPTGQQLETVAGYLLHSDFAEAARLAEELMSEIPPTNPPL